MVSLLDANILIALAWASHEHHEQAHTWLAQGRQWATCVLTQAAFVRLSSNPAVVGSLISPKEAAANLAQMTEHPGHVFWEACPSFSALGCPPNWAQGHRQVTDAYLLSLAKFHSGALATFDKRLANAAGKDGSVELLAAP